MYDNDQAATARETLSAIHAPNDLIREQNALLREQNDRTRLLTNHVEEIGQSLSVLRTVIGANHESSEERSHQRHLAIDDRLTGISRSISRLR